MNVAVGKSGKAISFCSDKWDIVNGDDVPSQFMISLAKAFPQHNFYLVSVNDYTKWKSKFGALSPERKNLPKNLIDIYAETIPPKGMNTDYSGLWSDWVKAGCQGKFEGTVFPHEALERVVNEHNLKFDFGIFIQGPDLSISIANKGIYCKTKDELFKPLQMAHKYVAPINNLLNTQKFPYVMINEDPRYMPCATSDLFHQDLEILCQAGGDFEKEVMCGYYEDSKKFKKIVEHYRYAKVETFFLNGKDYNKFDFSNPDHIEFKGTTYKKDIPFMLTLKGTEDREPYIEKWILANSKNPKVYGPCWSEEIQKKYPGVFEDVRIADMEDKMVRSKFTFIPFFSGAKTNFITRKFWNMIYYGIIPFFGEDGYDTDHVLDIPDYFRVKTPEEMWEKINYLTSPEGEADYRKYLLHYYNLLEDKYFNGEFIKELFEPYLNK